MPRLLIALVLGLALTAAAAEAQEAAPPPTPQPAPGFVQPKTPWGDPDIQGFWPASRWWACRCSGRRASERATC
jgi:hypothetical protein